MKSPKITGPRLPIKEHVAVALPRRALVAGTAGTRPGVAGVATAHTGRSAWKCWEIKPKCVNLQHRKQ